jgi:hypothetical protein
MRKTPLHLQARRSPQPRARLRRHELHSPRTESLRRHRELRTLLRKPFLLEQVLRQRLLDLDHVLRGHPRTETPLGAFCGEQPSGSRACEEGDHPDHPQQPPRRASSAHASAPLDRSRTRLQAKLCPKVGAIIVQMVGRFNPRQSSRREEPICRSRSPGGLERLASALGTLDNCGLILVPSTLGIVRIEHGDRRVSAFFNDVAHRAGPAS